MEKLDIYGPKARALVCIWRGARRRCPRCGEGRLFAKYLKLVEHCATCGEDYREIHADDMPPWLTIIIVGHVLISSILSVELNFDPSPWAEIIGWPLLGAILTVLILPISKGIVASIIWVTK